MPVGSNSEESTGRSHRGGIPASRAQRLAETVQKGPGLPFFSHFVILACVLCIMTVIGFGLGANFGYLGHQVAVPSVEAAPSLPTAERRNEIVLYDPPDPVVPPQASVAGDELSDEIETASEAPLIADDGKVQLLFSSNDGDADTKPNATASMSDDQNKRVLVPILTECVAAVEERLTVLRARFLKAGLIPWSVRQMYVTELVQQVIDCPQITLSVTGSLELLPLGLSDLEVNWSRSTERLGLRTVPVVSGHKRTAFEDPDGDDYVANIDSMSFVLR